MKIAYCGYDFFYTCLEKLVKADNVEVLGIFTFPTDNHYNFNVNMHRIAEDNGISITEERITKEDIQELFEEQGCDCIVTAAYPYKIPVNATERFKGVNVHPTLLPIGRGQWPLPLTILKQLSDSGVTIHKLNESFDAGDILLQESFKIGEREDLETLSCKAQMLAEKMISKLFNDFDKYWDNAVPQGEGEYWEYPSLKEMSFNFEMTVKEIDLIVRAYGKFDSCVNFLGKSWLVWDVNAWEESHDYKPGTLVHKTNKEYLFAAKDGFVCLRFFEEYEEEEVIAND